MLRILIADDHSVVREGLKQIIADTNGTITVDETTNGVEALKKIRAETYDLVILDIDMPGKNGFEVLEQIKSEKPDLPVLMLTVYPEEQFAVRALKMGAAGYLTKASAADELASAIHKVLSGGKYISSSLAEHLTSLLKRPERKPHEKLSNREYNVMYLIASGKTTTEIAKELSLSVKTVSTYRSRILDKLAVYNDAQLIRYAISNHLVD